MKFLHSQLTHQKENENVKIKISKSETAVKEYPEAVNYLKISIVINTFRQGLV